MGAGVSIGIARKLARAIGVTSETSIKVIDEALNEYVRLTSQSAVTPLAGTLPWESITDKPSTFAPSAHTHAAEDDIDGTGLADHANDGAAASGGISVGGLYRNGSIVMVRVA